MRLVRGENLKELIVSGRLSVARTLRVLGPIADALDTAHEAGLIHRDIKPQNILVGGRDHAYLADFGLTKEAGATGVTKTGQFVGTFDYVSPGADLGPPGRPPLRPLRLRRRAVRVPDGTGALRARVRRGDPVRPRRRSRAGDELRADPPAAIDGVIARAMAKDPDALHASRRR